MVHSDRSRCLDCLDKQREIDRLKAELVQVKAKLRYQERTAREGAFGSSTPSSKIPIKPSSLEERQARRGGAKPGHAGHGRVAIQPDEADRIERISLIDLCPDCGARMEDRGLRRRAVVDARPLEVETVLYELEQKRCPKCGCRCKAKPPGVLPKFLYGNQLLVHLAIQHYQYGQTLGTLEKQLGIPYSSLVKALHGLARILEPAIQPLVRQYRQAPVKHADETSWRTDGKNGYAWLFATPSISIFRFRGSRSSAVAKDVFGPKRLPGVLVVDRYHVYGMIACLLQYCYAHLLRNLTDLLKEFPDNPEIQRFVDTLAPLLAAAMQARKLPGSTRRFLTHAALIRDQILAAVHAPAKHPAIQSYQSIFREKHDRLFHWAKDRDIPADNNLAERDLRPLVIARKISFGSQSLAGAKTRETLMTVIHSLAKQHDNPGLHLKSALDQFAADPSQNIHSLLFQNSS